jgi:hypothetical protein
MFASAHQRVTQNIGSDREGFAPRIVQEVKMNARIQTAWFLLIMPSLLLAACGLGQFLSPTFTPTPTNTPTHTPAPTPTSTPTPAAIILDSALSVLDGPGTGYAQVGTFNRNEELDITGQFGDCSWLKVSSRSQPTSGWISGDERHVRRGVECEVIPLGTFRSLTTMIKSSDSIYGLGVLNVDNGTTRDALVMLTSNIPVTHPVVAAYIRAGDTFALERIPDGNYYIYFATGSEWNGEKFTTAVSLSRFQDPINFFTWHSTLIANPLPVWDITLHSVAGGTAPVIEVDESMFPDFSD